MLVSVIIPAWNEIENIAPCIAAARDGYDGQAVEIIVVDGGSVDGTAEAAAEQAHVLRSPKGRAVQMNAGARASQGEVLLFCHADSRLPAGWRASVLESLSRPGMVGGAFQTRLEPEPHWGLRLHNRIDRPPLWWGMDGSEAQFMWRWAYEAVGGFVEIPLMEDIEMSRALARQGGLVRSPLRVQTSSRRYLERGVLRQWVGNLWRMARYLWFGATPQQVARSYRSSREVE